MLVILSPRPFHSDGSKTLEQQAAAGGQRGQGYLKPVQLQNILCQNKMHKVS